MADRRLQVFYTVAKTLSFTKAADQLHMTQPAVTFQVRQLEDYFNTRLFDRTHNRINLTAAGEAVYRHADGIFTLYAEMEDAVRNLTGNVSGVLLLGASTSIAEYMLPSLLGNFKAIFPDVSIRLQVSNSENIVAMIENNIIDLGVVESPVNNKSLVVDICRMDKMVLVVPTNHPLAKLKVAPIEVLVEYPCICREEGSGTREVMMEALIAAGADLDKINVAMELGSPEAVKGAVEAGMGISLLSEATIAKELALKTLVAIDLAIPIERPFTIVHKKQKFRMKVMDKLLDFIQNYCIEAGIKKKRGVKR
ncbi:MAG: LysR family transcriptional regulator [Gammaproteobacteria bacterium]|nr:LysR family transcriptional regulator [Gammaproteobacteria bacterium]